MKRVLFFSTENACRSQMAEAFSIKHGNGDIDVFSAGECPVGEVSPMAIRSMIKRGFDMSSFRSKSLKALPYFEFDYVISLGSEKQPSTLKAGVYESWSIPDARNKSVQELAEIRNEIEMRVVDLLRRIHQAA